MKYLLILLTLSLSGCATMGMLLKGAGQGLQQPSDRAPTQYQPTQPVHTTCRASDQWVNCNSY